jgi:hypothetical protein
MAAVRGEAAIAPLEPDRPPVPPEANKRLEAARRAVAEAIVAAQDAGLVETSIDPPPILDILINGHAYDARTLKDPAAKNNKPQPYWFVTPEVFAAWFTGYGKPEVKINPAYDLRIMNPAAGLKHFYDMRAELIRHEMEVIRGGRNRKAGDSK